MPYSAITGQRSTPGKTAVDGVSEIGILTGRVQVLAWHFLFLGRSWPNVLITRVATSVLVRALPRCRRATAVKEPHTEARPY